MRTFVKPQYMIRAQITGLIRWTCPYCARVNEHSLKPTAFITRCRRCDHDIWWGQVAHIPAGSVTNKVEDGTVPIWADDEYKFDPIKFDPMPEAMFNPSDPIKQRGRLHAIVIHKNVYMSEDPLPQSPEVCKEHISEEKEAEEPEETD